MNGCSNNRRNMLEIKEGKEENFIILFSRDFPDLSRNVFRTEPSI